MSAPDPKRIHKLVQAAKTYLDEADRAYAQRYLEVYGPRGAGLGSRATPTHESRPTEATALAARSGALVAWSSALVLVHEAARAVARRTRMKLPVPDNDGLDVYPPLISPDQHQQLVQAQARRRERGEVH